MPDPAKLSFAVPAFNSYKEYDRASAVLSVTGTVTAGQFATFSSAVSLKRTSAITLTQFTTSVTSNFHTTGMTYNLLPDLTISHSNGSTATFPGTAPYDIQFQNAFLGDTVTVTVVVSNPNAETLTVVNETITVTLYTVVAPFA